MTNLKIFRLYLYLDIVVAAAVIRAANLAEIKTAAVADINTAVVVEINTAVAEINTAAAEINTAAVAEINTGILVAVIYTQFHALESMKKVRPPLNSSFEIC